MTKCPDCAKENMFESLFCKDCGRCLLAPDPQKVQWATVTQPEQRKMPEALDIYDGEIVRNSKLAWLEPSHLTVAPVILLLLNILVVLLVAKLIMYITS